MTLDDAIASYSAPGDLPVAGIEWALDHWDEAGPRFNAMLDAYVRGEGRTETAENTLFITIHLQAERGDMTAFAPLCGLLRDGAGTVSVLGDAIGDTLSRVLVSTYDGNLVTLASVVETVDADDTVRERAMAAMAYLTRAGQVPEEAMRAHLLRWLDELQPQGDHQVWIGWVLAVANLGWADLTAQAEGLFQREFIDPVWMGFDDFQSDLKRTLDDPSGFAGFDLDKIGRFGRVMEELKNFTNVSAKEVRPAPDADTLKEYLKLLLENSALDDESHSHTQPVTNPLRSVGRNDPCPCGSGKKYKKCCLV